MNDGSSIQQPFNPVVLREREREMEAEVATSGREARRRRILSSGSDRMALITGRIASPSPIQSIYHHSHTKSSPALHFLDHHPTQPPNSIHVGAKSDGDESDTSPEHDITGEFSRGNAFDSETSLEPQLQKSETNVDNKVPPSVDTEFNFLTPKEINSCILASESTRVFCSVTIALLVVLSYINLPRNIVKPKSIIASGPLYILLLTDVTILVAWLVLEKRRRGSEKAKEEEGKRVPSENGHSWDGAIKVLEIGLVFYQTVRAIFIDFSFYVVIVICGLSLM